MRENYSNFHIYKKKRKKGIHFKSLLQVQISVQIQLLIVVSRYARSVYEHGFAC